jgi:hypothetical protein
MNIFRILFNDLLIRFLPLLRIIKLKTLNLLSIFNILDIFYLILGGLNYILPSLIADI